ncbi:MAG: TonB-dependent receptor [Cytophagales bacterium]|nr:TonB-dependent receptor [Cytophagales bacterium]
MNTYLQPFKILSPLLWIWLMVLPTFGQTGKGTISGRILDAKKQAVPGVSVAVKGTRTGSVSDADGAFRIENVAAGEAVLLISAVGYVSQSQSVLVRSDETTLFDIELRPSETQLQTVEVTGRKETTYKNDQTFIATKTAVPIRDVPQSVSYVTKELIQDQAAFRLNEVVRNFSGVNQFSFYNDITIRGHRVSGGDNYAQLVNGLRSTASFWRQSLVPYLERVEVIKGPASALFGNTSPGGTINRVTKKPLDEARQSLNFTTGSFGTFRATSDFTGPMNEEKTLLYRLNLGYENAQSFRDLQFDKSIVIAPSVSFLPGPRTRLNFDVVYQNSNGRLDRGQAVFGNGDLFSVPISRSLNRVNDYLKEETYFTTVSLNHQFTDKIGLNVAYMRTGYEEDLLEHRTANTFAKDSAGRDIPTLMEMQVFIRKRRWINDNISNYLNIDFNTGRLEHKLVVGYDYAQETLLPGGSQLRARGYRNAANNGFIASYNRANRSRYLLGPDGNPVPNVPHFDLAAANPYFMADMSKYFYDVVDFPPTFYNTQGFYLQDQITIGRLKALLGFRQDYFVDKVGYRTPTETRVRQQAFIPRVGLTYRLTDQVNLYATYVQGYQPQEAARINNPNAGGPFRPLVSSLWETGAKTEWLNGRLTANLSVYRLAVQGALYTAGNANNVDQLVQIGEELSRGVEVDVIGQLAPNWSVVATYAYNRAEILSSGNLEEVNRQKPNAPRHQGSLWTKYVFADGRLKGLGFGLGSNFVTERLGSIVAAGQQPVVLPGYTLFNAAVYYQTGRFQIQLNGNNLTDKTHWVGAYDIIRLFPGAPRNWLASVAYTF